MIPVGPQVFDLLVYLLQNRERVVSKDDLLKAIWRGRNVSESTLTSHINAARRAVGDNGDEQKLIRTVARKGFRFVGDVTASEPQGADRGTSAQAAEPVLALPDRPSIAVLPFQNLSGDPAQDYFADGVVEEIITALSRMRWLFVIARNSSFRYKGQAVDVRQVGRDLGVRYVLEGSARKWANRVRITGQLIDALTGGHLWADRFDCSLEDIFDLQDQIATSVVGALAPTLERAEIERARHKPTENLHAHDYYLRGMASFYQRSREANCEALRLFSKAIKLDANYAAAHSMAACCYLWRNINGWIADREQEIADASRLAHRALELGKDDPVALCRAGVVVGCLLGDLDNGAAFLDQAIVLDPNMATAWSFRGWISVLNGESDAGIERLMRAIRLSPFDLNLYNMQNGIAIAHMVAERYDEASLWAGKAFRDWPNYVPAAGVAAASDALAGRLEPARHAVDRIRQLDPTFRVSGLATRYPFRRPQDLAKYQRGLRKAGLSE
jgi:TolB-like protein/tetratricopeptide (TPR) repeat protein